MEILSPRRLNRALLARQLLLHREPLDAATALERLVGLQAQAPNAPYVGLWSRLVDFAPAELADLLRRREAVRATLQRSTLHLVSTRDFLALRPLLEPVHERSFRTSPFARNLDGVDLDAVAAAGRPLLAQPRTRAELGRALASGWPGVDPTSLSYAVTRRVPSLQPPPRGLWGERGAARWVAAEDWLGRPLDGAAAPEELALRYLAAFGPASAADLAAWSGLSGTRALLDALRPRLRAFGDERGRELLDLDDAPRPDEETPAPPRFLPEYDNVLLSHADRMRVIPDGASIPLLPGNGAAAGTVLVDGFLRATWRLRRERDEAAIEVEPFASLAPAAREAVAEEGLRLLGFIAPDAASRDVRVG